MAKNRVQSQMNKASSSRLIASLSQVHHSRWLANVSTPSPCRQVTSLSMPPPQRICHREPSRTLAKRAKMFSTLFPSVKERLHNLDSGRCLITFEKKLSASFQAVHILPCKTKPALVYTFYFMCSIYTELS